MRVYLSVNNKSDTKGWSYGLSKAVITDGKGSYNNHDVTVVGGKEKMSLAPWIKSLKYPGITDNQNGDVFVVGIASAAMWKVRNSTMLSVTRDLPTPLTEFCRNLRVMKTNGFHAHVVGDEGDVVCGPVMGN